MRGLMMLLWKWGHNSVRNPTDLMLSCPRSCRILQFMLSADFAQGSSENWEGHSAGSNSRHKRLLHWWSPGLSPSIHPLFSLDKWVVIAVLSSPLGLFHISLEKEWRFKSRAVAVLQMLGWTLITNIFCLTSVRGRDSSQSLPCGHNACSSSCFSSILASRKKICQG